MNSAVCRSKVPRFSAAAAASLAYSEDGSGLTAVLFQRQPSALDSEVLVVGFGSAANGRRSGSSRWLGLVAAPLTRLCFQPPNVKFQGTADSRQGNRPTSGIGVRRHSPAKSERQQPVSCSQSPGLDCPCAATTKDAPEKVETTRDDGGRLGTSWAQAHPRGTTTGYDGSLDGDFLTSECGGTIRSCACRGTSRMRFSSIYSTRSQGRLHRLGP